MAFNQFDIVGAWRTYCTANNIRFVWQYNQFYANIEQRWEDFSPDELILVADLRPTPVVSRGSALNNIAYNGLIMLGRKFEDTTYASLDETALQKYDNRILELYSLLVTHITTFKCLHELDLVVGQIDPLFNEFDANVDFVAAQSISFVQ